VDVEHLVHPATVELACILGWTFLGEFWCIDDDVLEWFRQEAELSGGGSYQTMINEALRGVTTEGPTPSARSSPCKT
jgi:hypothetical protein